MALETVEAELFEAEWRLINSPFFPPASSENPVCTPHQLEPAHHSRWSEVTPEKTENTAPPPGQWNAGFVLYVQRCVAARNGTISALPLPS